MKLKRILYTAAFATMGLSLNSCSDYLDVSKELSQNLDKEQVFSNWNYMKQWYGAIYATMPNYSETGLDVTNNPNYTNVWALYSGELVCAHPNPLSVATSTFTPNSTGSYNRWWRCYQAIRQAMIFLENCPESIGDPGDRTGNYIPPEEMRRYKADVIYLLAYNYFQLFELYGPTPIIEEIADPGVSVDYARASVDEMVNHIDSLLAQLIEGDYSDALPDTYILSSDPTNGNTYDYTNMLRPTKATAMALRARLWVYAASPLFNGGYAEALQLTNKDGKRLFPDYDASKWQTAKQHLKTLLDFTAANGMKLYQAYKTVEEDGETVTVPDPDQSIYWLFQDLNEEIIWANPNNDYTSNTYRMEPRTAPFSVGYYNNIGGNVGPYQEFVDLFFTKNGLTIEEDPEYNEAGFTDFKNPCSRSGHVDKHIFNMYVNREPRFYADVTYQGKSWHIQPTGFPDYGAYFAIDEKSAYKGTDTYARAGYLLYKFNHRNMTTNSGTGYVKSWTRPWMYFRLADFYLYYAEVCNEIDPSDPNIITYLDMVRERAGIPGYRELQDKGIKTNVIGNQDAQREAIYRERKIEMFGEGNYYFDIRRWMRAGWTIDESGREIRNNDDKLLLRRGMDINRVTVSKWKSTANKEATEFVDEYGDGTYYNRIVVDQFPWRKAMLLYPIPYDEMQKSQLTVQNPLW